MVTRITNMETTHYSKEMPGSVGNHRLSARFDWSAGYLGISQNDEERGRYHRVLLSPQQVRAMLSFIDQHSR